MLAAAHCPLLNLGAGLLCLALVHPAAFAQVLVASNLNQPVTGGFLAGRDPVGFTYWRANEFTTDAYDYSLASITLDLGNAMSDGGGFGVAIYTSASGNPGNPVPNGFLSGTSRPTPSGLYTYTPSSALHLSANTSYFLYTYAHITTGYILNSSISDAQTGPWTLGDSHKLSMNGGATWTDDPASMRFSISATAIPELPSGPLVVSCSLGLVAGVRRWQQRKLRASGQ
jgi:hypothetical protein